MEDLQAIPAIPDRPSRTGILLFGTLAAVTLPFAHAGGQGVMWVVGTLVLASIVWLSPREDGGAEAHAGPPAVPAESPVPAALAAPGPAASVADPDPAALTFPRSAALDGPLELHALLVRLFEAAEPLSPSSAHVWVEDDASRCLRPLEVTGPLPPGSRPCQMHDEPVGVACTSGEAAVAALASMRLGDEEKALWRVAVPLDDALPYVVVALDIVTADRPCPETARACVDAFRLPLRAAVALRLAAGETRAARALCDALSLLDEASSPAAVAELALEGAMGIAAAATGSVMLAGEDRMLRIVVSRGLPPGFLGSEMREGEGVAGWVAMTRTPLLVEDQPERVSRPRPSAGSASISVPLLAGESLVGVLNVSCRDHPPEPLGPTLAALGMLGRRTGSLLAR